MPAYGARCRNRLFKHSLRFGTDSAPGSSVLLSKPPREIVILVGIGFADLVLTLVLHSLGWVSELNPLMRPLIESSALLFCVVKLGTLAAAYAALQLHRRTDEAFVRRAAQCGAVAYVLLWSLWVLGASVIF